MNKSIYATKKQVEKYENKILTGYIPDKVSKRRLIRLASTRYHGHAFDVLSKRFHRLVQLVLGNNRRGN